MKINEVVGMLYNPLDSDDIISKLGELGIDIPVLDDKYTVEQEIDIDKCKLGLDFTFKEINTNDDNAGAPVVFRIGIDEEYPFDLPYDIKRNDSYEMVKQKIGFPAIFGHKYIKAMRAWKIDRGDGKNYCMAIRFEKDLSVIKTFVIHTLLPEEEANEHFLSEADK